MSNVAQPNCASFEILPSGSVAGEIARQNIALVPVLAGWQEQAEHLGAPLPEIPRMLLLNAGERPLTPRDIGSPNVPYWQDENDVVVRLPQLNVITESSIALGSAMSLLRRRRENQRATGNRIGGITAALGLGVTGMGYCINNPWFEYPGISITLAGLGIVAYGDLRGKINPPDLEGVAVPVQIQSDTVWQRPSG